MKDKKKFLILMIEGVLFVSNDAKLLKTEIFSHIRALLRRNKN